MPIPIYSNEQELRSQIEKTFVRCCGLLTPTDELSLLSKKTFAENKGQPDLFYMRSILVSTGWNLNDDVFDCGETWAARHSPEDKPLNIEHKALDIIGHHTSNSVVDDDLHDIADDTPIETLPEKFHIITNSVIYTKLDDVDKQKQIQKILEEIAEGKWFVSMEAYFTDFDYALLGKSENRVISRNKSTSFLTKYLRVYGGTGVYDNCRIGRLLRNITFSGSGLVLQPANPDSIIFKNTKSTQVFNFKMGEVMNEQELKDLNVKYAEALKTVATLKEQLDAVTAEKTKLVEDNKKLTVANQGLEVEFSKLKAESVKAARLSKVQDTFGVDKAQAEKLVSHLLSLADDKFETHVADMKEVLGAKAQKNDDKTKALEGLQKEPDFGGTVVKTPNIVLADAMKEISAYAYQIETEKK